MISNNLQIIFTQPIVLYYLFCIHLQQQNETIMKTKIIITTIIISWLSFFITLAILNPSKPINKSISTGIDATGRTYVNGQYSGVIPNH